MLKYLTIVDFIIVAIFSSCDCVYNYKYQMVNSTNSEIVISLKAFPTDSIYKIGASETVTLFTTSHGAEACSGPYFSDVASDIDSLIVKKGIKISQKNYQDNQNWEFENGTYTARIENTEFE